MASSNITVLLTIGVITVVVVRIIYVIYRSSKPLHSKSPRFLGGHTAEMLNLLYVLQKERLKPRYYIAAATDNMSLQKAKTFEDSLVGKEALEEVGGAEFLQIYRSREVGQSYITSIGTTLVAIAHALWLMIKIRPQVILCNGPGTCVPLCVIAFLFKVLGIQWSSIFYVESIARVRKLSLSGLLLYKLRMADQLFVQWTQLKKKYPQAHYVGCLM
ncbi:UDP-N-acetylglucosamine transferase subunit ALG14 isoform X2 [Nicotiana tabacum]|uniref:UDP-N-acetylglucosamine transferase subunit ALG14 n=1 Tax=Nicotiana tabacum TaxID=4097 RepID=A0A1S3Y9U8_TOBAC|nr:PREDICTED: UDP-N-acetylglucosamine transferase subunit ALG14 homolog isoform X2 [Nicotiana tabacum]